MNLTLHIWRQAGANDAGKMVAYKVSDVSPDASFLEMLDELNDDLVEKGDEPVAFDHDCREGICGTCGMVINGTPHGPQKLTTTCQLHMRKFNDGDDIYIEPWRAGAFPVLRDLIVDRGALDRIIEAGGYISVNSGSAQDANLIPIGKRTADHAFDAATCVGCGACVAACPNASASLFTAAKMGHLGLLPQGQPERFTRATSMVAQMDAEGFGGCTNHGECEAACPKGISLEFIARMNRDFLRGAIAGRECLTTRR